jgi:hypothetical protein
MNDPGSRVEEHLWAPAAPGTKEAAMRVMRKVNLFENRSR